MTRARNTHRPVFNKAGLPPPQLPLMTIDDLEHGLTALCQQCRFMKSAAQAVGQPPLRRYGSGLAGLSRIIVAQQVSAASAAAIWRRLDTAVERWHPDHLRNLSDNTLHDAGLSHAKVRTIRAVTDSIRTGQLDFNALADAPDNDVRTTLTAISGIGPWTADIYILFCLARPDAFAPGDLALMTATQHLLKLAERPNSSELEQIAERWRPWRAIAARLLWAYHPTIRQTPISHTPTPKSTKKRAKSQPQR